MAVASASSLVLDYVRALVWPVLVAAILAYFLGRYRDNVGGLIDRINSLKGPLGTAVGFDPAQPQQQLDASAAETLIDEQEELIESVRHEYEERLAEEQVQQAELTSYLLNELAAKELQVDFERIYRVIYGTQVAALRALRAAPAGLPRAAVEAPLEQAKQSSIELLRPRVTFADWFGFLERNDLATAGDDGLYRITPKGVGFLTYIEGLGYPPRFL